jgi:hypothetical protein
VIQISVIEKDNQFLEKNIKTPYLKHEVELNSLVSCPDDNAEQEHHEIESREFTTWEDYQASSKHHIARS